MSFPSPSHDTVPRHTKERVLGMGVSMSVRVRGAVTWVTNGSTVTRTCTATEWTLEWASVTQSPLTDSFAHMQPIGCPEIRRRLAKPLP